MKSIKLRTTGFGFFDKMAMLEITWYENQMRYLGNGQESVPDENVYLTMFKLFSRRGRRYSDGDGPPEILLKYGSSAV